MTADLPIHVPKTCVMCGCTFGVLDCAAEKLITTCSEFCNDKLLAKTHANLNRPPAEDIIAKKRAAWIALKCPVEFETTDWSRATPEGQKELSSACATLAKHWTVPADRTGLGIIGSTGLGKTRALWSILKRHHFAGWKVMFLRAYEITELAEDKASFRAHERSEALRIIRKAETIDLLAIDDIGKEAATKETAAVLHRLIAERCDHRRPILFTSELDGEALAPSLGKQYADGLIRRFRQYCNCLPA